jgi:phospholipid-transporting ATPase
MHSGTGQTGASAAAGFQHSIFTFKDAELQGIIDENDLYKGPAKFPVKLRITSEDGKESINFRFQGELIHEYFMLLASAHECLVQTDD